MNSYLRNRINELAQDVIKAYEITIPIDNITSVVEKIGGKVVSSNSLDVFCDGSIKKENDSFSIIIPEYTSNKERYHFTVAHELGHLFLHMGYQIDKDLWNSSDGAIFNRYGNSEEEFEANEFAAAFLMPKDEYIKVAEKNLNGDSVDIRKVADYFKVSVDAASYRGKWLGYLQW